MMKCLTSKVLNIYMSILSVLVKDFIVFVMYLFQVHDKTLHIS